MKIKKQLDNNDNNIDYEKQKNKTKVYSTRYSQVVSHPSTNRARRCSTSVIGREQVFSVDNTSLILTFIRCTF